MKFELIISAEEISAILKETQRDQEVVLSFNIQLVLLQAQATRPGDFSSLNLSGIVAESIQISIQIFIRENKKRC